MDNVITALCVLGIMVALSIAWVGLFVGWY